MRIKNKVLIILLVLILASASGITYLNKVFLPQIIKAVIIRNIEQTIQKKVSLGSLEFSIFKGLVLKDLIVYEEEKKLINIREASCSFLILPVFRKSIIIPSLTVRGPDIFVERRTDNSINILELLPKKTTSSKGPGFKIFIYRLSIIDGRIDFQDNTLSPPFLKSIDNFDLILSLAFPDSLKFNLKAEIPNKPSIKIMALGKFKLPTRQLSAKVTAKDFSPQDFARYYDITGISVKTGLVDAVIDASYKDSIFDAMVSSQIRNLGVVKDKISANLNSDLKVNLKYNLENKQLQYTGKANIANLEIQGLEFVDTVKGVTGQVGFDNSGLTADKLNAQLFGRPVEAELRLEYSRSPLLNMRVVSDINLSLVQKILKENFGLSFPGSLDGESKLDLILETGLPPAGQPRIKGSLNIAGAKMRLENIKFPIDDIMGRLDFTHDKLVWSDLKFKYQDTLYKTSGQLVNFQSPQIHLGLFSPELSLESDLSFKDKSVKLKSIHGSYLKSMFDFAGTIDTSISGVWGADIIGGLDLNLADLKSAFKNYNKQFEQVKPDGIIRSKLNIRGNLSDIKSCDIEAKLSADALSIYGLKCGEFILGYSQSSGLAEIPLARLSLYDGTIEATSRMNLKGASLPYSTELNMQGIKIEKLKQDTPLKEKDISGIIQAQAKLNGFAQDLSRLSGAGRILINNGRLWQLDLFKGLGELLFTRDFRNIVFNEGYCDFLIKDKYIFTDNLRLKSNLLDLSGSGRVGFDGGLDFSINTQITKDIEPQADTVKDITAVLLGKVGKFAVIKLGGTLKQPKYHIQPAVVDVIKGLKNLIIKNIGK